MVYTSTRKAEEFTVIGFGFLDGDWCIEAYGDRPIRHFSFDSFGKTVFFTREEAENNM